MFGVIQCWSLIVAVCTASFGAGVHAPEVRAAMVAGRGPERPADDPGPGREQTGSRHDVLVASHVEEGELDELRLRELEGALRAGLARGDFEVVASTVERGCLQSKAEPRRSCLARTAREVGARHAVLMTLQIQRRDYAVTLEVVDAETATLTASSAERCEVCGIAEVRDVVDNQAAAIRSRLETLSLAPPTVVFESRPPGALVRLDGKLIGETPFERVLEPGTHEVEVTLNGYIEERQRLQAIEGVRTSVRFDLEPVPRSVRYRRLRQFGWAALGIGVSGTVVGSTLIGIDGRSNRARCDGENIDPLGNCKYLYATLEAGIATAVVGGALLVTAVGILVGTRDRRRQARTTAARQPVRQERVRVRWGAQVSGAIYGDGDGDGLRGGTLQARIRF